MEGNVAIPREIVASTAYWRVAHTAGHAGRKLPKVPLDGLKTWKFFCFEIGHLKSRILPIFDTQIIELAISLLNCFLPLTNVKEWDMHSFTCSWSYISWPESANPLLVNLYQLKLICYTIIFPEKYNLLPHIRKYSFRKYFLWSHWIMTRML